MDSLQLQDQDSKRAEAVTQLCELATRLRLAFAVGDKEMIIQLPAPAEVPLPIVDKLDVALEDDAPAPAEPAVDENKSENEA